MGVVRRAHTTNCSLDVVYVCVCERRVCVCMCTKTLFAFSSKDVVGRNNYEETVMFDEILINLD